MVLKSSRRQSTPTKRCVRGKLPAAPNGSGSVVGRLTTVKSGSSGRSFASSSSSTGAAAGGAGGCGSGGLAGARDGPKAGRVKAHRNTNRAEYECRVTVGLRQQGRDQP